MKKIFILCLGIGLLFSYRGFGQVGEKVFSVNILNMNNDTVALPMLGQKNLLIFYADPSHFTVIFINKNQVIEFYKAGQLTPEEQEQVIALVRKYSN